MKRALALLTVLLLAFLSGCSMYSLVPSGNSQYTIVNERETASVQAPLNDRNEDYMQRVGLYFVSSDRQQLTPISRTLTVRFDSTLIECVVERLLSASSSDGVLGVVPKGTKLLSVEESCGTVTVDLSSEAMNATAQELLWMKSAIANSILGASSAQYAHVLISGREQSDSYLPTGAMTFTNETLQAIWTKAASENGKAQANPAASSVARNITVYCPVSSCDYLLAQTRQVTLNEPDMGRTIAMQLAKAPENWLCVAAFGEGTTPESIDTIQLDDGGRVVRLAFGPGLYEALAKGPMSAWRFFAAITYTLCRNVPDLDGVVVQVGGEWVFDIASNGKSASFRDGIMRPDDFNDAVADIATMYFGSLDGSLASVGHVMSAKYAKSPRAIINELISGPLESENCRGLFPDGATSDDVLGIRVSDRAALINLSAGFYALCQNISFERERDLVYSIVNTLCEMDGVNRVRIFVNGESPDTLADHISIKTDLLPNPGLAG